MIKTTLTAAALLTAISFAAAPASAAAIGCSGDNLTKAEGIVDQMADGPDRWTGFREITAAQTDLLAGHMRGCAVHISHVMHMNTTKPGMMGMPGT